jgi:hypothetical protein
MRGRVRSGAVGVLAAAVVLAVPGTLGQGAQGDERCDRRTPSRAERALQDAIAFRAQFGLPRTPAYVRRVLSNRRYRRLGSEYGSPLTPRELRYMRARDRAEGHAGDAEREARRLAAGAFAGVSIEGDFRRGAYVAVRFTRDHARLAEAVGRRVEVRVRGLPARFTLAELGEAQDRLDRRLSDRAEREELERRDVHPSSWSVDVGRNRVVLEVISARGDVARFVRERYGGAVEARVVARRRFSVICVPIEGYRATDGGRTLELSYFTNSAYEHERVEVIERSDRVVVASFERAPNGAVTMMAVQRVVTARLSAPLGDRRVVDAETGRTLRGR